MDMAAPKILPSNDYLKYRELIGSFLDTGQEECIA
jgi:hypothetical protein